MQDRVHDRMSADAANRLNIETAEILVDDPYEPGAKILATRQLRHDQLAWLHSHGQIDEAQFKAGRAYQGDYERAERGARAIDPTKENVDGGLAIDPLPLSQMAARNKLVSIEKILGHYLVRILQAV